MRHELTKDELLAFEQSRHIVSIEDQAWPDAGSLQALVEETGLACTDPQLTVVTVCFNALEDGRQEMLRQCLDSVQQQQGLRLEHLIIDGASSDGTADVIRSVNPTRHPRHLLSLRDSGIYEAMNRGIALARGRYVVFLNTDDFYHSHEGLATAVSRLEENGCDFSFSPICVLGGKHRRNAHAAPQRHIGKVFLRSVISHQSLIVRHDVLLALHGFDLTYRSAADYDLLLRLLLNGYRGCLVNVPFVTYRMTGLSSTNIRQSIAETSLVLRRLYNQYLGASLTIDEAYRLHRRRRLPAKDRQLWDKFCQTTHHAFPDLPVTGWQRFVAWCKSLICL